MKKIAIVTGGAGGMGLATASVLGRDHQVILCDLNQNKLDIAVTVLKQLGISCDAVVCDITNRDAVDALFKSAVSQGKVVAVIHTAGLSPQMGNPEIIMKVNALGTINITEAAFAIAADGFALVNVASMAAHLVPELLIPKRAFVHAYTNVNVFLKKALFPCRFMPKGLYRNGLAYAISKSFVIWYSRKNAARFGEKNARIVSVSPGTFDTEMGRLEEVSGSAEMLKKAAMKRFGRPEEIAELLAFCASDKASYLTGVDIVCDGGVVASRG